MRKFKNKYRIPSSRLQHWNYGLPGSYFITICTKDRKKYFGEIEDGEMHLHELVRIAHAEWARTPEIRPDMNLTLNSFQVMPNHFHGILMIGENKFNTSEKKQIMSGRDAIHGVSTSDIPHDGGIKDAMHNLSTGAKFNELPKNQFGPQSKNLGSVNRGFKSSVTIYARNHHIEFDWQERFQDHIIRNYLEYVRISTYIINNPIKWKEDKFFYD
ncbi:MAG: hypothetical protein K1X61_11850 [Chitinophagales bacterium]|nr:hypothetical protein [Chitinophagales bacterium]